MKGLMTPTTHVSPSPRSLLGQLERIEAEITHIDKLLKDVQYRAAHGIVARQLPGFKTKLAALEARHQLAFDQIPPAYITCPTGAAGAVFYFAH